MRIILNIGLNVAPAYAPNGAENYQLLPDLAALAARAGFPAAVLRSANLYKSASEPTAVLELDVADVTDARLTLYAYDVAEVLAQDAVAVYVPGRRAGFLGGPRAESWGEFNPDYFLMPDGRTLAEHRA